MATAPATCSGTTRQRATPRAPWTISNGQWAGSTDVGLHPAGYQPTLIGDFNGDGTKDIAWYNASNGALDLWKISNGRVGGHVDLGAHPARRHPARRRISTQTAPATSP